MRALISVSALALISNMAFAENFAYELQIASPDLNANVPALDFSATDPQPSSHDIRVSLNDWYRGNPDVSNTDFHYEGIIFNGPLHFTAYDELSRQNPDLGGV